MVQDVVNSWGVVLCGEVWCLWGRACGVLGSDGRDVVVCWKGRTNVWYRMW